MEAKKYYTMFDKKVNIMVGIWETKEELEFELALYKLKYNIPDDEIETHHEEIKFSNKQAFEIVINKCKRQAKEWN